MLEHARLILMAAGGLLILGVILDTLRRSATKKNRRKVSPTGARKVAVVDPAVEGVSNVRVATDAPVQVRAPLAPDDLIIMSVMHQEAGVFDATKVKSAIDSVGFSLGDSGLYEFHEGLQKNGKVVFRMASATKPGVFENTTESHACHGLTLFMDMRDASNPLSSFEQMLKTAVFLRQILTGELREGQRAPWTPHSSRNCRESIRQYMASKQPAAALV